MRRNSCSKTAIEHELWARVYAAELRLGGTDDGCVQRADTAVRVYREKFGAAPPERLTHDSIEVEGK